MKLFKTLREEALEKVKNAKVFADKKSVDNEKDSAFSKKGQEATSDSGELEYVADKNKVHVTEASKGTAPGWMLKADPQLAQKLKDTKSGLKDLKKFAGRELPKKEIKEDIDQAYADWQDSVKKKNPEHADKIKFKSNSDQRHVISAEHGDRSFGTFNMKTGESEHLGEEVELDEANEYMWKIEGGKGKGKVFGDKSTTVDDHLSAMNYHSQEYQKAMKDKRDADVQHHGMKYHKHKDQIERLGDVGNYRKEEVELGEQAIRGEARSLEDKIKVAKEIYAEKLKSATSPADRAQAKEDHENLIKKLSESESLDEVSKTTLVSYIKKAARSAAEAGNEAGFKAGKEQPKYNVSDETPTEIKRHKGIALAARKLSK